MKVLKFMALNLFNFTFRRRNPLKLQQNVVKQYRFRKLKDGDLNDTRVCWFPFGPFCFDEINPFLATFNSLGSRITKESYGVHKYAFGRIRDIAATRSNTAIRHILDDLFTRLCAQSCRSVPPLTSQTKLDPLSFILGGEPKGRVFSKL